MNVIYAYFRKTFYKISNFLINNFFREAKNPKSDPTLHQPEYDQSSITTNLRSWEQLNVVNMYSNIYKHCKTRIYTQIRPIYIHTNTPFLTDSSCFKLESSSTSKNNDLWARISGLVFPRRSATMVLQKWVDEGNRVSGSELRRISKQLVKFKRYKHALEVFVWCFYCFVD